MGDVIELVQPVPTKDDSEFVTDLARFAEAIVSEADIKRKYRFGDAVWAKLGDDNELVRAIEAEKVRRIRNGSNKREKAQLLVVAAPDVLAGIMLDTSASPRHRIDSAKALDDFAANGPQAGPPASEKFIITINLSADNAAGVPTVLHFEKSIAIDPNDFDDDPNGFIAAIAMQKSTESGGGNNTI